MAFCQHHSIPTPLLDVTTSPLVALYFACEDQKIDEDGIVYVFSKNDFLEYDNILLGYGESLNDFTEPNLPFNPLRKEFMKKINYNSFNEHFINFIFKPFIDKLIKYFNSNSNNDCVRQAILNREKAKNFNEIGVDKAIRSLIWEIKYGTKNFHGMPSNEISKEYLKYLKNAGVEYKPDKDGVYHLKFNNNLGRGDTSYANLYVFLLGFYKKIPELNSSGFNYYVKTSIMWDRVRAQSGEFIVCLPNDSSNNFISYKSPDYLGKICIPHERKKLILSELNLLNINDKTMFLDLDHIAKHVVENYDDNH